MARANTGSSSENPKAKADRIISGLIGGKYDLLSEQGRAKAIEAIEHRGEPEGRPGAVEAEQAVAGDTRTAWQAARHLCASAQLPAALAQLDKLQPLTRPERPYERRSSRGLHGGEAACPRTVCGTARRNRR
jgi:hypothetical protein